MKKNKVLSKNSDECTSLDWYSGVQKKQDKSAAVLPCSIFTTSQVAPPPIPYLKSQPRPKISSPFFFETVRYKDQRRSCRPVLARTTRSFLARVNATLIRCRSLRSFFENLMKMPPPKSVAPTQRSTDRSGCLRSDASSPFALSSAAISLILALYPATIFCLSCSFVWYLRLLKNEIGRHDTFSF
jgi:hypothetical protein